MFPFPLHGPTCDEFSQVKLLCPLMLSKSCKLQSKPLNSKISKIKDSSVPCLLQFEQPRKLIWDVFILYLRFARNKCSDKNIFRITQIACKVAAS